MTNNTIDILNEKVIMTKYTQIDNTILQRNAHSKRVLLISFIFIHLREISIAKYTWCNNRPEVEY
jgi:hypothetical protein